MAESQIIHTPNSTGPGVRTVAVTTLIDGVPTVVQMQVLCIADEGGNIICDFASYNMQVAMLTELRAIRRLDAMRIGIFEATPEWPVVAQPS